MTTPTIREVPAIQQATNGTVSVSLSGAVQAGDTIVVFHGANNAVAYADLNHDPTTGSWTQFGTYGTATGSGSPQLKGAHGSLASGGAQSFTFAQEGAASHNFGCVVFEGAVTLDVAAGAAGTSEGSHDAPSVDPTVSDGLLLCVVQSRGGADTDYATPATFTMQAEITGSNPMAIASKVLASGDPTGAVTFTQSGSTWDEFKAISSVWTVAAGGGAEVTLAGTLPRLTGALTAEGLAEVTLAGTLPKLTGGFSAEGLAEVVLAGTLPRLTGSLSLEGLAEVVFAGTLPRLTGSFTVVTPGVVILAGTLPALTGSFVITPEGEPSMDSTAIIDAVASHAAASGRFERVNKHEPKNAPGNGLSGAVWAQYLGPVPAGSGLNVTSALFVVHVRIMSNMLQEPQDAIDPEVTMAVDDLVRAYSGDFTLGGLVRNVDLLGQTGRRLEANAGYLTVGGREGGMYRIMVIQVPLIINDVWEQTP